MAPQAQTAGLAVRGATSLAAHTHGFWASPARSQGQSCLRLDGVKGATDIAVASSPAGVLLGVLLGGVSDQREAA
jgi:hypothetical protein